MTQYKSLAYIFLLACMWGPSFFLIKIGLTGGIAPLSLAAMRVGFAALFLWIFIGLRGGVNFPPFSRTYLHLAVMGIFPLALPFALINIAEQYIDSAIAGIINGITPLATALLAHVLIHDERLTRNRIIGLTLGLIGFLCLLLPSLFQGPQHADTLSIFLVGLAALSYAVGIIYGRLFLHHTRTLALPTLQVSFAALYLLPLAFFVEGTAGLSHVSMDAWISIAILAFWGTACAFIVYFHILQQYGAIALGTSVFLLPIFGIIFGVAFLDEQLSWLAYTGAAFILIGMKLVHTRAS